MKLQVAVAEECLWLLTQSIYNIKYSEAQRSYRRPACKGLPDLTWMPYLICKTCFCFFSGQRTRGARHNMCRNYWLQVFGCLIYSTEVISCAYLIGDTCLGMSKAGSLNAAGQLLLVLLDSCLHLSHFLLTGVQLHLVLVSLLLHFCVDMPDAY